MNPHPSRVVAVGDGHGSASVLDDLVGRCGDVAELVFRSIARRNSFLHDPDGLGFVRYELAGSARA